MNHLFNEQLQLSIDYLSDDLTWCLAASKQAPLWKNIFSMFPSWMWPFVFGLGYFNGFLLYLLMLFDTDGSRPMNYHSACLNMFSTHIVMSNSTYRPTGFGSKTFFAFLLFYGFLVISIFNSFFIQNLTSKIMEPQIATIEEIVYYRMDVAGSLETRFLLANGPQDEVCKHVKHFQIVHCVHFVNILGLQLSCQ